MFDGVFRVPTPRNEPVLSYAPGSPERTGLKATLKEMLATPLDVPMIIGGKEVRNGDAIEMRCPHDHSHPLGVYHSADVGHAAAAIAAANAAKAEWSSLPWGARATVFLKAAELLAGRYRPILNAATMLNMSKTCHQAEIDASCELIDFWRFNPHFVPQIYGDQPASSPGILNYMDYRPLEGFVFAITPFNFTSIAGNLPTAPVLMGNTAVWKPASSAVLPAHFIMQILKEAGLPDGVINMIPGPGESIGPVVLEHIDLGGVHFTGSTYVFSTIWLTIGSDIRKYASYPRIVGETGGKNFLFAHVSADVQALTAALVRGAFEYQGQKCSAASRAYIPDTIWPEVRERLLAEVATIKMGDVFDFTNFMGAVIDRKAFKSISGYLELARTTPGHEVICGGKTDDSEGLFVEPTIVVTEDPKSRMMMEEVFGPVLTVYVYPEAKYEEMLYLCDQTSPYGLTGSIFARDRLAIQKAADVLRQAAGNFYINDKPTGSIVGQQPFGGARASGTNDKAGSPLNLLRWTSPRAIKETLEPPTDFRYPFMADD